MSRFLHAVCSLLLCCCLPQAYAAAFDSRMQVDLNQAVVGLDIHAANELALPTLWQRIVPASALEKANALPPSTALILQFSPLNHGVKVVYNPSQVRSFLRRNDIGMVPYQPHWNLSIQVLGFPALDVHIEDDLLDDSAYMAEAMGFKLSPRGRKLALMFTPSRDTYGQSMLHVAVQGAFSADLLSKTEIPVDMQDDDALAYQLRAWLHEILRDIRDAYSLGDMVFSETTVETLLTIEGEHTLATQVMLEQALAGNPALISLTPVLLQKERRQYRMQLRDGQTAWIKDWFAEYGLTAMPQPEDSFTDWLVQ